MPHQTPLRCAPGEWRDDYVVFLTESLFQLKQRLANPQLCRGQDESLADLTLPSLRLQTIRLILNLPTLPAFGGEIWLSDPLPMMVVSLLPTIAVLV